MDLTSMAEACVKLPDMVRPVSVRGLDREPVAIIFTGLTDTDQKQRLWNMFDDEYPI